MGNRASRCCGCGSTGVPDDAGSVRLALRVPSLQSVESNESTQSVDSADGNKPFAWLTFMIKEAWTEIEKWGDVALKKELQKLEPAIHEYARFQFTTVSIGKRPALKFGDVKYRSVSGYRNDKYVKKAGVALDIECAFDADCNIKLEGLGISVGISRISIHGSLSVFFRPFISQLPLVGATEISFTNPPKVVLEFTGFGSKFGIIREIVRQGIVDAIDGYLVTPNRIPFPFTGHPVVTPARLSCPTPDGVLRIRIKKATDLLVGDVTGTSDPYVIVKCGANSWKTSTVYKTLNPVWAPDNVQDFFVFSPEQQVQFDVFDEDPPGKTDDHLGSVTESASRLVEFSSTSQSMKLKLRDRNGRRLRENSQLHVDVDWLWIDKLDGKPLDCSENLSKYVLQLKIDEITDLFEKERTQKQLLFPPFKVRLSIKNSKSLTVSTSNPGWAKAGLTASQVELSRIRLMVAKGYANKDIAEIVEIDEDLVATLAKRYHSSPDTFRAAGTRMNDMTEEDWLKRIQDNHATHCMRTNPQFQEVIRLLLPSKDVVAVVELLNDPVSSGQKAPHAVARFEVRLGARDVLPKLADGLPGPFALEGGKVEGAQLHGDLTLSRLSRASRMSTLRWLAGKH